MKATKLVIYLSLVSLTIFFSGCETTGPCYEVGVSGLMGSPLTSPAPTYVIQSGIKDVPESDLQFSEYACYLETALKEKAYRRLPFIQKDSADMVLVLVYGISAPKDKVSTVSTPVLGQTGVFSATSYGNTTYFTPSYGVTGYNNQVVTDTTYLRQVQIDAYDAKSMKQGSQPVELWRMQIQSEGSCGDLRTVFPVLIASALPYYGANTGQVVQINIYEDSTPVKLVKGMLPPPAPAAVSKQ